MRYDPKQGISLDLSSRKKIVIQPSMMRKESTNGGAGLATKALVLGSSIFNRAQSKLKEVPKASPAVHPQESSKGENKMKLTSRQNPKPGSSKARISSDTRARETTSTNTTQSTTPGILNRDTRIIVDTEPQRVATTEVITPNEDALSLYSEEYIKCGCGIDDQPRCSRCLFLQLTESFCNTIDAQHRKWKITHN